MCTSKLNFSEAKRYFMLLMRFILDCVWVELEITGITFFNFPVPFSGIVKFPKCF